ncbi:MAG: dihydropteroate synthase [Synergistaceae bacterium]|nr:dihydropteroate synthase [Synergistaceae bacterium]
MMAYPLDVERPEEFRRILEHIGADPRALGYLQPKRRTLCLFVPDADYRAAAFIKQELLSRGGDAAVAKHVIDGKAERSDILLMGTDSQLARLLEKMKAMDCWGLKELREELSRALQSLSMREWTFTLSGGRTLTLNGDTKLMGILNLTPDSFHAPSRIHGSSELLRSAGDMLESGAAVLDVGAESTRPGSKPISEEEERERLIPAIQALRRAFPNAVLSVDTYKGSVALAAADAGADLINDVGGGEWDPSMLECAARTGLPYILSCPQRPESPNGLIAGMRRWFRERLAAAETAGLSRDRVILDPGLGFDKDSRDNFAILKGLNTLRALGRPLLVGHSRKRFTGLDLEADSYGRLHATVALSALLEGRAQLLRVHDLSPNRRALLMARSMREASLW